jgi:multidrug efflux pump subunit AcrA (membrane-fusion protein)
VAAATVVAKPEEVAETFEAGGVVRARTTAVLTSRIAAPILEVRVKAGDRVKADEVLVVLDDRDLKAADDRAVAMSAAAAQARSAAMAERDAAHAGLTLAESTHRRIAQLREKGSATPHELDEATAGLHAAQARVRSAEARLAEAVSSVAAARAQTTGANVAVTYARILAPFSGTVAEKHVEAGNMASPGVPLLTLEDPRSYRVEVRIDESRAGHVEPGAKVAILLAAAGAPEAALLEGTVGEVARALEAGSHTSVVKIDLPAGAGLRSGMFARARFTTGTRRALMLPASSVIRRGQVAGVFLVDGQNRARMRAVRAGAALEGRVEILSGVEPDDVVIVEPPPGLVDGTPIAGGGAR